MKVYFKAHADITLEMVYCTRVCGSKGRFEMHGFNVLVLDMKQECTKLRSCRGTNICTGAATYVALRVVFGARVTVRD